MTPVEEQLSLQAPGSLPTTGTEAVRKGRVKWEPAPGPRQVASIILKNTYVKKFICQKLTPSNRCTF